MTRTPDHISIYLLMWCVFGAVVPCLSVAEGWQDHTPDALLAIDKSKQIFLYFTKDSDTQTLSLDRKIPCTTGMVSGDKIKEGDKKTPEGIYFIEGKKEKGLDFGLYGDLAFVLNFPNPVDQAKGKTGHGIWIHGRGKPITPYETRGCVALNNHDINQLQSDIRLKRTPVVISDALTDTKESPQSKEITTLLVTMTRDWASAWDKKSSRFFSLYDISYFSKSFIERKKRLFQKYLWIDVVIDAITCITGSDYCVTYFNQLYAAPGFSSKGLKRLYWKHDKHGVWKIVGSEWFEAPVDLTNQYREKLIRDVKPWLEGWRKSWEQGNIKQYLTYYADNAVQGHLKGRIAIGKHKRNLIQHGKKPTRITLSKPIATYDNGLLHIRCMQKYCSENGYTDQGMKDLVIQRLGEDDWKIVSENWKKVDI